MKQCCRLFPCSENKGISNCKNLKEGIDFLVRCFSAKLVNQVNMFFHLKFVNGLSVIYFMEKAKLRYPCLENSLILFEEKGYNKNPTFIFYGSTETCLALNRKFGGCLTGRYWILSNSHSCNVREVLEFLKDGFF